MPNKIELKKVTEFTGHQQPIYCVIAAPQQGRFFSAGGDKMVVEWNIDDPSTGVLVAQLPFTIYSLCVIKTSNILLAGTSAGGIHIINMELKKEIKYFEIPDEGIFDIQYSDVHQLIIASTAKGSLVFIDPVDFSLVGTISLSTEKIRNISFNTSRPYLYAACADTKIYVVDILKREKVFEYAAHNWACNAVYYNAAKDELITASKDAHIRIWDIKKEFKMIKNIPAHNYAIYQLIYHPTLHIYATASRDKTIKLWDEDIEILLRIDKEKYDGHSNSVNTVCWLYEKYLVSGGDDRKIMLWEIIK
jgi:WD40 repeat protein